MRTAPTIAAVLLLASAPGCRSAPPLVPVHVAAADPYAVPPAEALPPVVRVHAPRIEGWSQRRHAREVAAISSLVSVELDLSPELAVLTGPEPATEVAAAFLADRVRADRLGARVDVRRVRCPADAWSFEALSTCAGGLWAVVTEEVALQLVQGPGGPIQELVLDDGDEERVRLVSQQAYLGACDKRESPSGAALLEPRIQMLTAGDEVQATAHLVPDDDLLVLRWRQRRVEAGAPSEVLVRNTEGTTWLSVSLPRLRDDVLEGSFVLRRGEALVLVQAPFGEEDLRLTVLTWSALRG